MKPAISCLIVFAALTFVSCNSNPPASRTETTATPGTGQVPGASPVPGMNQAPGSYPGASGGPVPGTSQDLGRGEDGRRELSRMVGRESELPSGMALRVRLDQDLSTSRNQAGETFTASLDEPVVVDGREILPRGTRFTGRVTAAKSSGHLEGRGVLGITLTSFELKGESYPITTSLDTRATQSHKNRNLKFIGGGTGLGAIVGAIAGHGKGALIGAGAGAAAGTATAAATGKQAVEIPAESVFSFRLKAPVRVKG